MAYDIFISYSHDDTDFVTAFNNRVRAIGIQTFLDEKEIAWGGRIPETVHNALENSKAIVVVLSPGSQKSEWVPYEVGHANARKKPVLPLLVHRSQPRPPFLIDVKYLTSVEEAVAFFQSSDWQTVRAVGEKTLPKPGNNLDAAIDDTGLVDLENRELNENPLPPTSFFMRARSEIAIVALSAARTFDQEFETVEKAISAGKRIRVLLLAPDSPAIPVLSALHKGLDIRSQIEDVITKIRFNGLHKHPLFELRLLREVPPFTCVMRDGDIGEQSNPVDDENGEIRVQPATKYQTQHRGLVFQFRKAKPKCAFDLFASDVRALWRRDGKPLSDI